MQRMIYFLLGILIGYWLGQMSHPAPPPAPPRPAPRPEPEPEPEPDNLTEIKGIGPSYEQMLNQMGIYTFSQLAQQQPAALAAKIKRVPQEHLADWIEQAHSRSR